MSHSADERIESAPVSAVERELEAWTFRARWLMAPFYVGLILSLAVLLLVFVQEAWHEFSDLAELTTARAVVAVLSLIDLSLIGNLILIVVYSGYETFVSKIAIASRDRMGWMGSIDFSGLKLRLMASLVAISAVVLMRGYMLIAQGEELGDQRLAWMVGIHLTFVISCVLLALMDFIAGRTAKH